jgi:hypothetical protein
MVEVGGLSASKGFTTGPQGRVGMGSNLSLKRICDVLKIIQPVGDGVLM